MCRQVKTIGRLQSACQVRPLHNRECIQCNVRINYCILTVFPINVIHLLIQSLNYAITESLRAIHKVNYYEVSMQTLPQ